MNKTIVAGISGLTLGVAAMAIFVGTSTFANGMNEDLKSAVELGDYAAFQTAAAIVEDGERGSRMLSKIQSEEDFNNLASKYQDRQVEKSEFEAVVATGDVDAVVAKMQEKIDEKKLEMEEKLADNPDLAEKMADKMSKMQDRMTEENLREKAEELVEYHSENGELPSKEKSGKFMKRGLRQAEKSDVSEQA